MTLEINQHSDYNFVLNDTEIFTIFNQELSYHGRIFKGKIGHLRGSLDERTYR